MTLERTLVARCDGEDDAFGLTVPCGVGLYLEADTTQPYVDLIKLGWTVDSSGQIYCHKHSKEDH